ncbi:MAG: DUF7146 domain-containing protein [Methylocella sp.]
MSRRRSASKTAKARSSFASWRSAKARKQSWFVSRTAIGCSFLDAVTTLAKSSLDPVQSPTVIETKKPDDDETAERRRKIDIARGIWNRRRPIIGTVAEYYLRFRGLEIDEDHFRYMGFDPEARWREDPGDLTSPLLRVPSLIAGYRLIEGIDDEIVAIQKTRLNPDGSKWVGDDGKTARRFNGCPKGAVIKIDPDENVTRGLILGEGLETALSARALGFQPIWAAGTAGSVRADGTGSGGIAGFPVLAGVECLTLLTERDEANKKATAACTRRWQRAGKDVLFADPPTGCGDVNDILQRRMARA